MPELTEEQGAEFTGERVIPGRVDPNLWNEHVSRYHFAATFVRGGNILDVGCGAGYGTALLAAKAERAIGFDIATDAIDYARAHHGDEAEFLVASAERFPLRTGIIRTVTAFEVIEHIHAWPSLIAEAARVLEHDGVFLVSTPNKSYYAETRKESGPNPFHVHEFDYEEFRQSLAAHFPYVEIVGQNRQEAFIFSSEGAPNEFRGLTGSLSTSSDAHFYVAVCTKKPLPVLPFAFVPGTANLLREREHHIAALQQELAFVRSQQRDLLQHHKKLTAELEEHNAWAMGLDREVNQVRRALAGQQEKANDLAAWAERCQAEADEKSRELQKACALLEQAENRISERTEWAYQLQQEVEDRTRELRERDQLSTPLLSHPANEIRANGSSDLTNGDGDGSDRISSQSVARLLHERKCLQQSRWLKLGRALGIGPKLEKDFL
jgi:SAM-dependent methyltransferase